MPDYSLTEAGAAFVAVGTFIAGLATAWVTLRKQNRSELNEDHQQKVHGYEVALQTEAKVSAEKEKVIQQLAARVDELEEERSLCRTEKATLAQENKWLRDELTKLRGA
jgi:uncharacterized membrane protein